MVEGFNLEILLIMMGYAILNGFGSLLFKVHYQRKPEDDQESLLKLDAGLPKTLWNLIKDWRWTLGEVLLLLDFVVYQFALSRYEVSVVKPLVNLNLIFVITFGVVFMKEKITKKEVLAIIFIILGSVMITFYSVETETVLNLTVLYLFGAIVFGSVIISAIVIQKKSGDKNYEYFVSIFSGCLYGLGAIFNKAMYQEAHEPKLLYFLLFATFFGISYFIAFVYGQFAYSKGRMSFVSTIVNITSILIPFIGGIIVFAESFLILIEGNVRFPWSFLKIGGLVVILFGILMAYNPNPDNKEIKEIRNSFE